MGFEASVGVLRIRAGRRAVQFQRHIPMDSGADGGDDLHRVTGSAGAVGDARGDEWHERIVGRSQFLRRSVADQSAQQQVVAEGIEDLSLVERVRALGCDLGQGYFFAKPLPSDLATAFIEMDQRNNGLLGGDGGFPTFVEAPRLVLAEQA